MVVYFLNLLFRVSTRIFFRNLEIKGLKNIPQSGPVLLVANHPSTFMDPIVITATSKRRIYFLAKAEVFKSSFSNWLLPKLNMIPVYRAQDDPTQLHKNEETFTKCFEHLKSGGTILIFPEGISLTERRLKKIKTGAARIALGAEAGSDFKLGMKIVCIGLNYSDPHSFQSDLFINIDEPIHIHEYEERYKADAVQAVNDLTHDIRAHLEKQMVAIEEAEMDKLVSNIELIYKSQLMRDLGYSSRVREQDFLVTRAISERVHYFSKHEPARVERIRNHIDQYFTSLDRVKLNDRTLKKFKGVESMEARFISVIFYMVIGSPVFIFGLLNNYLPYKLPGWIIGKITKEQQFYGAFFLTLGTFTFLLFYTAQLWAIQYYFQTTWLTLTYLVISPLSGLFSFFYWKRFINLRGRWVTFSLFYKKESLITAILNMRQGIIDELELGRKDFSEKTEAI